VRLNGTSVSLSVPPSYRVWLHTVWLVVRNENRMGGTYRYRVGGESAGIWRWSDWSSVEVVANISHTMTTLVVFADMGTTQHAVTITRLLADRVDFFDGVLVAGDLSYADGDPKVWDHWGELISPVAQHRPWITALGNHEYEACCGDTQYTTRLMLPRYYSLNLPLVHVTVLDIEEVTPDSLQYKWLVQDLQSANQNRVQTPWLVILSHKPLYCTNTEYCDSKSQRTLRTILEPLLKTFHVDLYLAGHVHAYERTYPIHNGVVHSKTGTIHLLVGTAGAPLHKKWGSPTSWSAARMAHHGWGFLRANTTHLFWEMFRSDGPELVDYFIKNRLARG
jgi:hypothetical protein